MTLKKKTKKKLSNENPNLTFKKKNGGAKLGQGSYGCVITPPINCLDNQLLRNHKFENNEKYISKIIDVRHREVAFSELNIGNKIFSIDRKHNYTIPFINSCYFTPQKHQDIIYLSKDGKNVSSSPDSSRDSNSILSTDSSESFDIKGSLPTNILKENRDKCILSKTKEYLNLIGLNAGNNLSYILNLDKNSSKIKFMQKNYWYLFSYMVHGLYLLHNKNIIHKDIKPSNFVVDFNYQDLNKIKKKESGEIDTICNKSSSSNCSLPIINNKFRYIDFGLSVIVNRRKYRFNDIGELFNHGTHYYTPIEIFGLRSLYKLVNHSYDVHDIDFYSLLLLKVNKVFEKNKDHYHFEGIRNNNFHFKDDIEDKNKNYYITPLKYETILKRLITLHKNDQIPEMLPMFLKGWDIYSLGITFAKIAVKCNIIDPEFKNIIFKMIDLNFEKRITINELKKDPHYIENIDNLSYKKNVIDLNY
jgi:serine/threonine protein kinase